MFPRIIAPFTRRFSTSLARRSEELGGIPGQNLPFDINNPVKMTVWFILFFGSGLSVPFLCLRHSLTK